MSIVLVTKGRLGGIGGGEPVIIREQFTKIDASVVKSTVVTTVASESRKLKTVVSAGRLSTKVTIGDSVKGRVTDGSIKAKVD